MVGAKGPVGEVDRRPLLFPDNATALTFFPRVRLRTARDGVAVTIGAELASASAGNRLPSSPRSRSMRSCISAAFLRVEEDRFTKASYAWNSILQEASGRLDFFNSILVSSSADS